MPKNLPLSVQGSAAVDFAYLNAQPVRQPVELPEEQLEPQQQRSSRIRPRAAIAPVSVLGFAVATLMLILVVFGYVRLYEATTENANLASELSGLRNENAILAKQYEGQVDLGYIEQMAMTELGMQKVLPEQIVYVNLSHTSDRGVVITAEKQKSFLGKAVESILGSLRELKEYLS